MDNKNRFNLALLKLSSFQIVLLGFLGIILLSSIILMLPICSKDGTWTNFVDALFTSTSAVCVTGLVVFDTATHFSIFGQIIILILIQIGGMGVIMVVTLIALITGRKIGIMERDRIKNTLASHSIGGIIKITGFILKRIFIIELIGALLMMPVFITDFGAKGVWMSFFHSISAFCNAGFDLMGEGGEFSSFITYYNQPIINIVIMSLIVIGGIGFLVWNDFHEHKFHLKRYSTQSKLVLIVSLILILGPALYFFFFEYQDEKIITRILVSLFQSITTRTAGFNTTNLSAFSSAGIMITVILMLIGGSPGSTAGGMKTTTLGIAVMSSYSVIRNKEGVEMFGRRINEETVKQAFTIISLYISFFILGSIVIFLKEDVSLQSSMFECASALGTVGLTLGITPSLSVLSKFVIMTLMYFGRVGLLTIVYATFGNIKKNYAKMPIDKITVG